MHTHGYMKRCLELAQHAKGYTAPNPMVGAVLVYNDHIIGEGWHKRYGESHAEINCLNSVSESNKHLIPESTMYVNLEPCAHHGKTPPCAVRLVEEKVKKVVIANKDPFEKVGGRGIKILQEGGVEVETGVLEKEARWVNRRFFCFHEQKRPYIILKWAQTQEGYFAPLDKSRFQISNRHSQSLVHKWRTEEGAIMVGYNTALYDDPQLTSRLWQGKQPLRIVVDRYLKLPNTLHLFDGQQPTWVVNELKHKEEGSINYKQVVFDDSVLNQIAEYLHQANILSVIIEGGAALLNNFIDKGLWDEARIFIGEPTLLSGISAPILRNAEKAFRSQIDTDELHVYTNSSNIYTYVQGIEL